MGELGEIGHVKNCWVRGIPYCLVKWFVCHDVFYARSDMPSGPAISSQLPRNASDLPTSNAEEMGESNRRHQHSNVNNASSQDDVATPRRPTQQLLNRAFTRDDASYSIQRPGGTAEWHDQWNHDPVWFEAMPTRQRSNNNEYRRHRDERCFVRYISPGYSDVVHVRSNHQRPLGEFTAYRHDFHSGSGQTVDLWLWLVSALTDLWCYYYDFLF